jgi:hypothetical protein
MGVFLLLLAQLSQFLTQLNILWWKMVMAHSMTFSSFQISTSLLQRTLRRLVLNWNVLQLLKLVGSSVLFQRGQQGFSKELTSHLIKVFERVIRRELDRHIERLRLIPDGQNGSRTKRSTLTPVLSF